MPSPSGSDSDEEYVELFNTTDQDISIDGWDLQDANDAANDRASPISGVTVPADGFVLICRNTVTQENGGINCGDETSITLNNTGDDIILRNSNDDIVDQVNYTGTWPFADGESAEFVGAPGDDNNSSQNWQEASTKKGDFAGDSNADFGSPNANATGGALPVELASFEVSTDGQRGVLMWQTSSETNNAGFAVQHQSPASSDWRKIGYREGEGTTTQPQSYRFTTDRLGSGTHTFRLKQVDTDGTAHFSAPKTVAVRGTAGLTLLSGHPVVRGQSAVVSIEVPTRQSVTVTLYDVLGQQVRTVTSTKMAPGQPTRATVSTADLSSGIYFLRAQGASFQQTKKLTVVQ